MIATTANIVFSGIAIFTRNEKFHAIFAIVALAYLVVSGFIDYELVG